MYVCIHTYIYIYVIPGGMIISEILSSPWDVMTACHPAEARPIHWVSPRGRVQTLAGSTEEYHQHVWDIVVPQHGWEAIITVITWLGSYASMAGKLS